jgi:hypothetical protein
VDTLICGRDVDVPPGAGAAGASVAGKGEVVTGGASLAGRSGSCAETLSTAAEINAKINAL